MLSGALACGLIAPLLPHAGRSIPIVEVTVGAVLGSYFALVPDFDCHSSKLKYSLPVLGHILTWLFIALSKWTYHATRTDKDKPNTNGHRGLPHTPVFQAVLALLGGVGVAHVPHLSGWAVFVGVELFVGQLAHSLGDCCTKAGVPMWWPLLRDGQRWKRVGIPTRLRFIAGGKLGVRMFRARSRGLWDICGETVVTFLLGVALVGLGAATLTGAYPAW